MAENERGFHHPRSQGHDHNTGSQGRMTPPAASKAGREATNHGGHTYEHARRSESDARINSMRSHAGAGQRDHEKILHDSHKLHQTHANFSHGNKHGESHHLRDGGE